MNDFTNFHSYSHAELRKMVQSMDSGGVMAASDPWRKAAQTLKDIRTALNTASLDATSSWQGDTSDAFLSKMSSLANTVNNASAYANDAAVSLQMMSEAIDTAKRDMPEEPGFWDSLGDGAKGFAESAVGMDNATTEMSLADRRKNQAVTVMETLAVKYRATTSYLKPPPPLNTSGWEEDKQEVSPADAIGALILGGGMGVVGTGGPGLSSEQVHSSNGASFGPSRRTAPQPPKPVVEGPTDAGIKGGTANHMAPKPPSPTVIGAGTGIDGVQGGVRTGGTGSFTTGIGDGEIGGAESRGLGAVPGTAAGGYGLANGGPGGLTGGTLQGGTGIGQARAGLGGRGAGAFGGGLDGEGSEGAGGRSAMGAAGKAGGAAGEAGAGAAGKKGFTEGGSGIGRGRGAGQGAAGQGQGHGAAGGAHGGKNSKKQGKKRPDYLVEDEETWMSGEKVNPDVVE